MVVTRLELYPEYPRLQSVTRGSILNDRVINQLHR